ETTVKSVNEPKKFYRIVGVAMIVVGATLLVPSVSSILNPTARCQDNLEVTDVLADTSAPVGCIDPTFEIVNSSSDSFVIVILSICLLAFGGAILGMINRLGK
ncbi:MAG: hypothetical protein ACREBU_16980, partial [Nitrososphaera sp.]